MGEIKVKIMSEIKQGTLKILSNKLIDDKHFVLSFENEGINPEAGQFIMIDCISKRIRNNSYKCGEYLGPLLKRPFSFFLSDNDKTLSILYKVKEWGKGTGLLPNLKPGDEIYYGGPLGKPIDIDKICKKDEVISLIAGGVGIAPITFLAQKLIHRGYKVQIYFGVPKIDKFLDFCLKNLNYLGLIGDNIMISSELALFDRSFVNGKRVLKTTYMSYPCYIGNTVQALEVCWKYIIDKSKNPVFVCGPEIVMKYIHTICALKMKRSCYVYLEEHMGCGKGVCCSCNVEGHLICKDGPCINSKLVWN